MRMIDHWQIQWEAEVVQYLVAALALEQWLLLEYPLELLKVKYIMISPRCILKTVVLWEQIIHDLLDHQGIYSVFEVGLPLHDAGLLVVDVEAQVLCQHVVLVHLLIRVDSDRFRVHTVKFNHLGSHIRQLKYDYHTVGAETSILWVLLEQVIISERWGLEGASSSAVGLIILCLFIRSEAVFLLAVALHLFWELWYAFDFDDSINAAKCSIVVDHLSFDLG